MWVRCCLQEVMRISTEASLVLLVLSWLPSFYPYSCQELVVKENRGWVAGFGAYLATYSLSIENIELEEMKSVSVVRYKNFLIEVENEIHSEYGLIWDYSLYYIFNNKKFKLALVPNFASKKGI